MFTFVCVKLNYPLNNNCCGLLQQNRYDTDLWIKRHVVSSDGRDISSQVSIHQSQVDAYLMLSEKLNGYLTFRHLLWRRHINQLYQIQISMLLIAFLLLQQPPCQGHRGRRWYDIFVDVMCHFSYCMCGFTSTMQEDNVEYWPFLASWSPSGGDLEPL